MSVSAFIARMLDDALKRQIAPEAPPFRLVTVRGEGIRPGVDLDRPELWMCRRTERLLPAGAQALMLLPDVNALTDANASPSLPERRS